MKWNNSESRYGLRRHDRVDLYWALGLALVTVLLGAALLKAVLDSAQQELPLEASTPSPDPTIIHSIRRRGGRWLAGSLSRWSNPMLDPLQ